MQSVKSKTVVLTVATLILVSIVAMPLVSIVGAPAPTHFTVGPPPADFPTIQDAIDAAALVQGDVVIHVEPGVYGPIFVPMGTDYVTIESTGGADVTAIGPGAMFPVWIRGSYITLRGFTMAESFVGVYVDWPSEGSWIVGNEILACWYGLVVLGDETVVEDNRILWGQDLVLSEQLAHVHPPKGIVVGNYHGMADLEDALDFIDIQDATDAPVGELLADDRVDVPEIPILVDARDATDQPAVDDNPALNNWIVGNVIKDYFVGIAVMFTTEAHILENRIMYCYIAIAISFTDQVYIRCNTIKRNSWGIIAFSMNTLEITENLIKEHIWIGITLLGCYDVRVGPCNTIGPRNWIGILAVECGKLRILSSRVIKNHRSGIVVAFSWFVRVIRTRANNNMKCGILLWSCGGNLRLSYNKAKNNFEDGIILLFCGDYAVNYNVARNNLDDGIQIAWSGDGFVRGNQAFDNRDWDLSWVGNTYDPSVVWTLNEFGPNGYDWFPPPYPDA